MEQTQYPFPDLFPWGIYLACHDFRTAYAFAPNLNKRPVGQPSKPSWLRKRRSPRCDAPKGHYRSVQVPAEINTRMDFLMTPVSASQRSLDLKEDPDVIVTKLHSKAHAATCREQILALDHCEGDNVEDPRLWCGCTSLPKLAACVWPFWALQAQQKWVVSAPHSLPLPPCSRCPCGVVHRLRRLDIFFLNILLHSFIFLR